MNEESSLTPLQKQALQASERKMIFGLVGASLVCVVLTFFAPSEADRTVYSDFLTIITSFSAFAISVQVIIRQKTKGIFAQLYLFLGLAFGLWFAAEAIWIYYETGLGIEMPFPSLADAFWLGGYVPFSYFLMGLLKNFLGLSKSLVLPVIFAASLGSVLIGNILLELYKTADLSTQEGLASYMVSGAYPIVDMFLLVPAVAALLQLRNGWMTFMPWVFIVTGIIVFIIADIGFAFYALSETLVDSIWIWDPLYNIAYVAFACSLLWHKEFFTVNEKKLLKAWQERNR
jgi:hypothetical protein